MSHHDISTGMSSSCCLKLVPHTAAGAEPSVLMPRKLSDAWLCTVQHMCVSTFFTLWDCLCTRL